MTKLSVSYIHSTEYFGLSPQFPTPNIASPIVLLYGDIDSLVDIESMKAQLPADTTTICVRIPFSYAIPACSRANIVIGV